MSHTHQFDRRWPFEDADNTAVYCCEHVFLCGDSHVGGDPRILCFGCVIELDPSLWSLADLPLGWAAERRAAEGEWTREETPPPEEEDDH